MKGQQIKDQIKLDACTTNLQQVIAQIKLRATTEHTQSVNKHEFHNLAKEFEGLDRDLRSRVAVLTDEVYILTQRLKKMERKVYDEAEPILKLVEETLTKNKDHLFTQLQLQT